MTKIAILVSSHSNHTRPSLATPSHPLLKTSLLELEIILVRVGGVGWWGDGVALILKQVGSQLDWPTGTELGKIDMRRL